VYVHYAREIVKVNGLQRQDSYSKGRSRKSNCLWRRSTSSYEWMGYFLLYESMMDTVLFAEQWLSKGGLILPDECIMRIAAMRTKSYRKEWEFGFGIMFTGIDMSSVETPFL